MTQWINNIYSIGSFITSNILRLDGRYCNNVGHYLQYWNEPPHDKTNKMTVRPAKTQISLVGKLLLVRILSASASASGSFLSALYHLNQWVDLDQTGTDTSLGRGKDVIRFDDLDLISRSHQHFECQTCRCQLPRSFFSAFYLLNQ